MPFEKGKPRAEGAGRKAGVPNKKTDILAICEGVGLNPFLELAKIASDSSHERRFDAIKELCQYIEPKKKSVDVVVDPEANKIEVIIKRYGT